MNIIKSFLQQRLSAVGYKLIRQEFDSNQLLGYLSQQNLCGVIDVGAASGGTVTRWAEMFPAAKILAFEPRPDAFQQLTKLSLSQAGRLQAFQIALGSQSGRTKFQVHEDHGTSSSLLDRTDLSAKTLPFTRRQRAVDVEVRRLDDIPEAHDLVGQGHVLLKLDVQGAEDQVLIGAATLLRRIRYVFTEITLQNLYEGQCDTYRLFEIMKAAGYHFSGFIEQFHGRTGTAIYSDLLFENIQATD